MSHAIDTSAIDEVVKARLGLQWQDMPDVKAFEHLSTKFVEKVDDCNVAKPSTPLG